MIRIIISPFPWGRDRITQVHYRDVNAAYQSSDQSDSADLNSSSQFGMVQSGSPRQDIYRNQGSGKPR